MSKRIVLGSLVGIASLPMLVGATAPVGLVLLAVGLALLALARLGRARSGTRTSNSRAADAPGSESRA